MKQLFLILLVLFAFLDAEARTRRSRFGVIQEETAVTSSGGTTTAVATSDKIYRFSGSTSHTFVLPDATTLPQYAEILVINDNTNGTIDIQDNGNNSLGTLAVNDKIKLRLSDNGDANGTWKADFYAGSITGNDNYLTETTHDALPADNPHSVTFTQSVTADSGTDISTTEAETLTDGSDADSLHTHTSANLVGDLARNQIANATADQVLINLDNGEVGSEAQLAVTRGGTALSAVGSANQLFGTNSGASAFEHKSVTADATGAVVADGSIMSKTALILEDPDAGTNVISFKAPTSLAADKEYTLPATDGSSGYALTTDGAGTLTWSSAGGAVSGSANQLVGLNSGATAEEAKSVTADATGGVVADGSIETKDAIILEEPDAGTTTMAMKAAASMSTSYQMVWPPTAGVDQHILKTDGSGNLSWVENDGGRNWIIYKEEQANGNDGTASSASTWTVRVINVIKDPNAVDGSWATYSSSNRILLTEGTYHVRVEAAVGFVETAKVKIYNQSDSTDIVYGQNCKASASGAGEMNTCVLEDVFVIGASKYIQVLVWTGAASGYHGVQTTDAVTENYLKLFLRKIR